MYVFEVAFVIIFGLSKGVIRHISLIKNTWPSWLTPHQKHAVYEIGLQLPIQVKIKERGRCAEEKIMLPAAEMLWRPGVWEAASPLAGSMSHFSHSRTDRWLNSLQPSRLSPSLTQMCTLPPLLFPPPHQYTGTRLDAPSHLSFSMCPLIRATQGQYRPSHHLQPVLMSPLFFSASHADRRQHHNDNKPLLHFKRTFFFAQIAEQKLSKWSTYCVIFWKVLNRPKIQQALDNEEWETFKRNLLSAYM